uniref:Ribosomal protein L5 n=1 Tax=Chaetosphaeridium globosum TaxID=96477 RepID=Q8M1G2_CHAGL|nr:ribosomal protein L5 [Chaetosphaeridium globosum]AAM96615.1 ribosomal protein L5 [Chaetosphaeridium globosum]
MEMRLYYHYLKSLRQDLLLKFNYQNCYDVTQLQRIHVTSLDAAELLSGLRTSTLRGWRAYNFLEKIVTILPKQPVKITENCIYITMSHERDASYYAGTFTCVIVTSAKSQQETQVFWSGIQTKMNRHKI